MQISNHNIYSYAIWIIGLGMLSSPYILLVLLGYGLIFLAFALFCRLAYQEQSLVHLLADLILMVVASFIYLWIPENIGNFRQFIGVMMLLLAVLIKNQVYKKN